MVVVGFWVVVVEVVAVLHFQLSALSSLLPCSSLSLELSDLSL